MYFPDLGSSSDSESSFGSDFSLSTSVDMDNAQVSEISEISGGSAESVESDISISYSGSNSNSEIDSFSGSYSSEETELDFTPDNSNSEESELSTDSLSSEEFEESGINPEIQRSELSERSEISERSERSQKFSEKEKNNIKRNIKYRITKYEFTRVVGARATMIKNGGKPLIGNSQHLDPVEIARMEISHGICPINIVREFPEKTVTIKLNEATNIDELIREYENPDI